MKKDVKQSEDNFDINENKKVNLQNIKNIIREKYIKLLRCSILGNMFH
jgi:hypothetical protein